MNRNRPFGSMGSPEHFDAARTIAEEGIRQQAYPGCHVLITKGGYPVYNKCFGTLTYDGKEEVKEHTIYDLASLSKAAGTLLAIMKLYDEGKFGLTDKSAFICRN